MQRFTVVGLGVVLVASIGLGAWVSTQVESSALGLVTQATSLYVDSIIEPHMQSLAQGQAVSGDDKRAIEAAVQASAFGQQVVAFKIWTVDGQVVFGTHPNTIGQRFPPSTELKRAVAGETVASIRPLTSDSDESPSERLSSQDMLELYRPIMQTGTQRVIAVAEFHELPDAVEADIRGSQRQVWFVIAAFAAGILLVLLGSIRHIKGTLSSQAHQLAEHMHALKTLHDLNQDLKGTLDARAQAAAAAAVELSEKTVRRVGEDLHDGPAQDVGFALLRLDQIHAYFDDQNGHEKRKSDAISATHLQDVLVIKDTLQSAMAGIRAIALDLALPHVGDLNVHDALVCVTQSHACSTGTQVALVDAWQTGDVPQAIKVTLCRIVREALTNGYRHGQGINQRLYITGDAHTIQVEVADDGPGFDPSQIDPSHAHLGIVGMRDRTQQLGGLFQVTSKPGHGTTVLVRFGLDEPYNCAALGAMTPPAAL